MIVGEKVTYHHGLLDEDFTARIVSTTARIVVIEYEIDGCKVRRVLTHKQAEQSLSEAS